MNCREFVDFLMAYLEDELDRAQRGTFEDHIGECPSCDDYLKTYEQTIRLGKLACAEGDEPPEDAPEALIQAILAARVASTPATFFLKTIVPRLSSIGLQAAAQAAASLSRAASSSFVPMIALAAFFTSRTVGATAPSETRADFTVPLLSSVRLTAAPTTAMSISVRGMKRR